MDPATVRGSLAAVRPGLVGRVMAVPDAHRHELGREGIRAGVVVGVETIVPFGGPVIVAVGRARVALARRIAAAIEIEA
ncbi:MAG TPA: FeoA domain-containing protein [Candidatus Limnocylindrales bacterium]|nr:FeoA domain-containing protein [Candidatus Limnocylindrales bacterium]